MMRGTAPLIHNGRGRFYVKEGTWYSLDWKLCGPYIRSRLFGEE